MLLVRCAEQGARIARRGVASPRLGSGATILWTPSCDGGIPERPGLCQQESASAGG